MVSSRRIPVVAVAWWICLLSGSQSPVRAVPPGEFKEAGSMSSGRSMPSGVVLDTGKVLVTGGEVIEGGKLLTHSSAELFDPATETFALTGSMSVGRIGHATVRLKEGRVLVVGGFGEGERRKLWTTAEIYDPGTGSFSTVGAMIATRVAPTATLLKDGRVLIVGGLKTPYDTAGNTIAELFDPATGQFQQTGSTAVGRGLHDAVLLPDGRVAVIGGGDARVELYDPATGQFAVQGRLSADTAFWGSKAFVLPDGRVLVAGGTIFAVDVYDPATGKGPRVGGLRLNHWGGVAIPLGDGRVLFAGGGQNEIHGKSELIDLATGAVTPGPMMPSARGDAAGVRLLDGRGLIVGGSNGTSILSSALLYLP
jgi:hypothetical protein